MLVSLSPTVRKRLEQLEVMRILAEEWRERYEKALSQLAEKGIEFRANGDDIEFADHVADPTRPKTSR